MVQRPPEAQVGCQILDRADANLVNSKASTAHNLGAQITRNLLLNPLLEWGLPGVHRDGAQPPASLRGTLQASLISSLLRNQNTWIRRIGRTKWADGAT